jgi:putative transcription factor
LKRYIDAYYLSHIIRVTILFYFILYENDETYNFSLFSIFFKYLSSDTQLEEATEVGTIAKVDRSLSKAIMQARTAKKITQKELATAINEKPQVVAEYESGKAIPNPQIISKLERKLGTKLPRPGKSKLPPKTSATGTKKPGQSAAAARGITRGGPAKRR